MVSIIVPIFNTDKYLSRCIQSILNQTYKDYEIILVNDGSTDNSKTICDEYALNNKNITVFHKTNGGVSSARNCGIINAKGELISFVDSDDELHPDYLNRLIAAMGKFDCVVSSMYVVKEGAKQNLHLRARSYTLRQLRNNAALSQNSLMMNAPVNKLYKLSIIQNNGLRFDETLKIGEDALFNYNYYYFCSAIICISDCLYYYHMNAGSAMHTIAKYAYEDNIKLCKKADEFFRLDAPKLKAIQTVCRAHMYMDSIATKLQFCENGDCTIDLLKKLIRLNNLQDFLPQIRIPLYMLNKRTWPLLYLKYGKLDTYFDKIILEHRRKQ